MLTSTLNVPRVADAVIDYMLALPGNEDVQSINPLVGETNDGYLNDIRGRAVGRDEVFGAIKNARGGAIEEGSVGAGTGTVAFGFKGGIGTSSRKLPASLGGYTVGVLVQTNFGGILTINGAPVGRELGQYYLKDQLSAADPRQSNPTNLDSSAVADGSVIIVIATDAPIDHRNLQRLAARAMMGLARARALPARTAAAITQSHSQRRPTCGFLPEQTFALTDLPLPYYQMTPCLRCFLR
jgi:D-aminopeptidase